MDIYITYWVKKIPVGTERKYTEEKKFENNLVLVALIGFLDKKYSPYIKGTIQRDGRGFKSDINQKVCDINPIV